MLLSTDHMRQLPLGALTHDDMTALSRWESISLLLHRTAREFGFAARYAAHMRGITPMSAMGALNGMHDRGVMAALAEAIIPQAFGDEATGPAQALAILGGHTIDPQAEVRRLVRVGYVAGWRAASHTIQAAASEETR